MTRNYMPSGPDVEIDYSQFTYGPKQTSANESDSKPVEFFSSDSDPSVVTTTSMPAPVDNAPKIAVNLKYRLMLLSLRICNWRNKRNPLNKVFNYNSGSKFRKSVKDPLAKPTESEGFKQILDFLNGSSVRYALTASPTIRTSCIKQFWSTAKVKTVNDEVRVQALIDEKRVTIKESSIHCTFKLAGEEGISCLANDEIFTGLANMGYEKISDKPTFYKAFFLPQWNTMASAIIYLAIKQKFNFSRDMSHHQDIYDNPSLFKKVFANMKRLGAGFSGVITPLFENILVPATEEVAPKVPSPEPSPKHQLPSPSNDPVPDADKDGSNLQELMDLCTRLSNKVLNLESEVIDIKFSFTDKIEKVEDMVHKLEEENKILKEQSFKSAKVDTAAPVKDKDESFKQGRMIADMDEDVEVNLEQTQAKAYNLDLEHSEKVLSMQVINKEELAEVEEVLEVVTAAKLITEVVTTAAAQVPKASAPRRRRGVIIQDLEETTSSVVVHTEQDEAFARQLEAELNANKNWNDVIEQVKKSERQNNKVMRYQALKRKPLTEAQARKNMMIYLKNMAGFKMNFFKGITYSEIRPLFEKHYNLVQAFLEKGEEEVTIQEKEIEEEGNKRQGESLKQEITKKQRIDEEAEELKRHLHIMANDDDDVADGTHKLFLSFITLLKNFDIEDLETLWKLVKERFETTEPKNFSDDFLINILMIMFEKPNVEANTFLLVEKKYPLKHFTLEQMLNNVRLEVEEKSEMSLE
nr:hypothetical protein [Tanacetum cinerariifolium]